MSYILKFVESSKWEGVLHWRCEFERASDVLWIPVPFDDLLLECSNSNKSAIKRRPSSEHVQIAYQANTILYGTRMTLNKFIGLHIDKPARLYDYEACNSSKLNLSLYAQNTDRFLSEFRNSIDVSAHVSDRTIRRRLNSVSGMSKTQLHSLITMHDFLSTACGYGTKNVTLTNSINPLTYYDQPHFDRNFSHLFGYSPTEFFTRFSGLPEQLLSISYKRLPDFHYMIAKVGNKEK